MRSETSTALSPLWDVLPASDQLASSTCELPARFEAVWEARQFTRLTLQRWELPELLDTVALVASELVTNALRHGMTPLAAPVVRLSLARLTSRVVCAVRDPSSAAPVTRTPDFVAESGRGLHLVASCSETWGWHPLSGAGKVVWALFPTE
ncbi:ATP-binding protein [Streptomyces sp. RB6PN25]|uniref:ATP-binding protein n=1 Tax=Streptomyces humicola TaxID=2953240 RepID=A0ABT1PQW3_9ACTN|nr:ATP-binding protein [Streptomyces humicola]MCQ4080070.1 ATP-binding protein [Streptomyces humicola]